MTQIYGEVKNNIFICSQSREYKYKKEKYMIAYDGEIYNLVLIKEALLAKGYYFDTYLDEEIVLKAFIEYGADIYNKFSGSYSIIIWMEYKKEMIFMRDYFCIKSLYYRVLENGDIIFSNVLDRLLLNHSNTIQYEKFVKIFLEKCGGRIITEDTFEADEVVYYQNKRIIIDDKIANYLESNYLFEEVTQSVLKSIGNLYFIRNNIGGLSETEIIAREISNKVKKEMVILPNENCKFDSNKLKRFFIDMEMPFFNTIEYNLVFLLDKIENVGIIESGIKRERFYNINFFCRCFDIKLICPELNRKAIIKTEGICKVAYDEEIHIYNYLDNNFVKAEFINIVNNRNSLVSYFIKLNEISDYYEMIYIIRLNNWLKKYNVKIK